MPAKLTVLAGPDEGKIINVPNDAKSTLGRGDLATLRLNDPTVSRVHCSIEYRGDQAVLRDEGSKTGTKVDGKPIKEHHLQQDDMISIGSTKMRFGIPAAREKISHEEAAKERGEDPDEMARRVELPGDAVGVEGLRKPGSIRPPSSSFNLDPPAESPRPEVPLETAASESPRKPSGARPAPAKVESVPELRKESGAVDTDDIHELRKLSGTKLGHFQIGPVVGVGSSGLVFKAQDVKENREVALKIYTADFAEEEEALQRFIRAVKTMLPMRHSNLVTLYGGGKTGPYCWMAMEYVECENLKETIARIGTKGKLDWRPAMRMALDIGRGLYYIHGENIIHRSLSPGNILFSKLGTVKLGSLILAKALSGALAKDVTVSGHVLGDIYYLSPEQVGSGGAVDQRADIYSFGALVYALLTGKPPFVGGTPLETATWIVRREVTSPRKVDPNIPPQVEKMVLKMLQKNPQDRYQTAGELMLEMEALHLG